MHDFKAALTSFTSLRIRHTQDVGESWQNFHDSFGRFSSRFGYYLSASFTFSGSLMPKHFEKPTTAPHGLKGLVRYRWRVTDFVAFGCTSAFKQCSVGASKACASRPIDRLSLEKISLIPSDV